MNFKKIFSACVLMASTSWVAQAQTAKTFKLEVEQSVQDTTLLLDFFVQKTTGADIPLGSSNFAVYVSYQNLDLSKMKKVDSATGIWDMSFDPASYREMGLGGTGTFVNLTVKKYTAGTGAGQPITETRTRVGRVSVPITNRCGTNTMQWIVAPAAITNFADQSIKAQADFIAPAANQLLCATPVAPQLAADGATSLCEGQSVALNANVTGGVQWYRDGELIEGATSATYVANQTGQYTAQALNCACTNNSLNTISVEMSSKPAIPTLNVVADTLFAAAAANYQWYQDGQIVAGATSQYYVPTATGNYSVGVSNQCGISMSESILFAVTGVGDLASAVKLKSYPNPFAEQTQISYTLQRKGAVKIEVTNMLGQRLETLVNEIQNAGEYKVIFKGSQLSTGTYFLKVQAEGKTEVLKLVQNK